MYKSDSDSEGEACGYQQMADNSSCEDDDEPTDGFINSAHLQEEKLEDRKEETEPHQEVKKEEEEKENFDHLVPDNW